ncbi:MAG: 50S ribosomal protein L29 [Desulfovibrionaceae bacterium]|nr:50S ribosomal protein L29 [Desulfovibrionaceae bacterium]
MTAKELRNMTVEELRKALKEARENLFTLRFKHAAAQLEKVSALPAAKHDIARILTILKEKEA